MGKILSWIGGAMMIVGSIFAIVGAGQGQMGWAFIPVIGFFIVAIGAHDSDSSRRK